jgi:hypothetical protein
MSNDPADYSEEYQEHCAGEYEKWAKAVTCPHCGQPRIPESSTTRIYACGTIHVKRAGPDDRSPDCVRTQQQKRQPPTPGATP